MWEFAEIGGSILGSLYRGSYSWGSISSAPYLRTSIYFYFGLLGHALFEACFHCSFGAQPWL